jgi:hypothetical protein
VRLYKGFSNASVHKIRIQKQFTETLVKYQHRGRALKAVAVAATVVEVL